jgi:hypothetical protein
MNLATTKKRTGRLLSLSVQLNDGSGASRGRTSSAGADPFGRVLMSTTAVVVRTYQERDFAERTDPTYRTTVPRKESRRHRHPFLRRGSSAESRWPPRTNSSANNAFGRRNGNARYRPVERLEPRSPRGARPTANTVGSPQWPNRPPLAERTDPTGCASPPAGGMPGAWFGLRPRDPDTKRFEPAFGPARRPSFRTKRAPRLAAVDRPAETQTGEQTHPPHPAPA